MTAILIIAIFPLLYTFLASFKSNMEILVDGASIIPKNPNMDNYRIAWGSMNFNKYVLNSIIYSSTILVSTVAFSAMGGYVFAKGNFKGKMIIFTLFTSTMFINLGNLTIFPLLQIAKFLNLNRTLWGLIIIKIFGVQIVNMFLVRGFVLSLPNEIMEAAKIDGCSFKMTFFRIVAPLLKPIMATVAILSFQHSWNDYLLPMVFTLSNPRQMTLVAGIVALKGTGNAATSWNLMLAGSMMSIIPVLIIYSFASRYFVNSLVSGAVKG